MQEFMDFILDLYDDDDSKWEKHRSFYISMDAMVKLDFSEKAKTVQVPGLDTLTEWAGKYFNTDTSMLKMPKMSEHVPVIFGRIEEFEPRIHELKVFKGSTELMNEAQ